MIQISQPRLSVSTLQRPVPELLNKEWLLTNNCGGYSSSSIVDCNTRRYHGLLVGALNPPVDRIVALSNCIETVISGENVYNISSFEFPDRFIPGNFQYLTEFSKDTGAHFDYKLPVCRITKSIYLPRNTNTAAIVYEFDEVSHGLEFIIRPVVALRDFHTLQKSFAPLISRRTDEGLLIRHDVPESCELFLNCSEAKFTKDQQWWYNFLYRADKERGQEFKEDLWTPGFYKCHIEGPCRIVLWADLSETFEPDGENPAVNGDLDAVIEELTQHQQSILAQAGGDSCEQVLSLAAEQFVTQREKEGTYTILAGYPWFADWGRDAFISLPGLLLSTKRFDQAKSVLTTFAGAADRGMIPNRFDDRSDSAYFNSIDASLWFVNAAFQYLKESGDLETFEKELLKVIENIITHYRDGTRFDIHADTDGLITGGNDQTQLTWMDAKYEGQVFTPRYGKAVEINALWYNGLCFMADYFRSRNDEKAAEFTKMAEQAKNSFQIFWNQQAGYLNDCIFTDGKIDTSFRSNQTLAISLEYSPLTKDQQESVVQQVEERLLTPYGLRTLDPADPNYIGRYTGPQSHRDKAYHQGTVWPYLIGSFIEAYLKVNQFSDQSKQRSLKWLEPLLMDLTENGCIGSISENFDGDAPQLPKGCIAQAWSVAELLRVYKLIRS